MYKFPIARALRAQYAGVEQLLDTLLALAGVCRCSMLLLSLFRCFMCDAAAAALPLSVLHAPCRWNTLPIFCCFVRMPLLPTVPFLPSLHRCCLWLRTSTPYVHRLLSQTIAMLMGGWAAHCMPQVQKAVP